MERKNLSFKPQINGLRACAVILVLAEHSLDETFRLKKLSLGFVGIRLFFVISGYLISRILLTEKQNILDGRARVGHALRQFYVRRFLRIFPPYYLLLGILTVTGTVAFLNDWQWHTFYLSNFLVVRNDGWIGLLSHFWSLSVEEQFYFFWPLLVFITPWRWIGTLCVLMIVTGGVSRGLLASQGYGGVAARSFTGSCLDSLGGGALLAYLEFARPRGVRKFAWGALGVGLTFFVFTMGVKHFGSNWVLRAAFFDLSAALVLVWAVAMAKDGLLPRLFNNSWLGYIGKISYGIYLFHPLLPYAAERLSVRWGTPKFPPFGALHFLVLSGAAIAIATASWYLYEKPINELKRYFPYV